MDFNAPFHDDDRQIYNIERAKERLFGPKKRLVILEIYPARLKLEGTLMKQPCSFGKVGHTQRFILTM